VISVVIPVFRNATGALELIHSLRQQELPSDHSLEIIVVDDGSDDDSTNLLCPCESELVRVVIFPRNMGRSKARNAGAELARGEFLAFVDCDCRPLGTHFLATHLELLHSGCIATCGPVIGNGCGFWSRYQSEASNRRARQHAQGVSFAGSTQNFTVRREVFHQVGGFDARYKEYGFEDRDLFVRLSRHGAFGWCADAIVKHLDALTLPAVLGKMQQAAGDPAMLFSREHPEAYRLLRYASIDARIHPWLRFPAATFAPLLHLAPSLDVALSRQWLPYIGSKVIVKLLVALAFTLGSIDKSDYARQTKQD
jgi:hypothetical protein